MYEGPTGTGAAAQGAEGRHRAGVVPCARDFAIGSVVAGKYQVELVVGEGGVGSVVKAKHLRLEHSVAIKYVKPLVVWIPGVVERFLREARLAAKIQSDHAVRVYDVDTVPCGVPYMVMEYLEGRDLRDVLDDGGPYGMRLEIERAIDYVLQGMEALAEAHAAGIVHRDLKPENLFLAARPDGSAQVKVLDFGISKVIGEMERHARTSQPLGEVRMTNPTDTFGTPGFMSPEQIESSGDVDARADIWSLGVTLHELMTGTLPFEGQNVLQLRNAILTQPPMPLRVARPDAPAELEAILRRCLEKDRDKRYRDVGELAEELAPFSPEDGRSRLRRIAHVLAGGGERLRFSTPVPHVVAPRTRAARMTTVLVRPRPRGHLGGVLAAGCVALLPLLCATALPARARDAPREWYAVATRAMDPVLGPTTRGDLAGEPSGVGWRDASPAAPVTLELEAPVRPAHAPAVQPPSRTARLFWRAIPTPPREPVADKLDQPVDVEDKPVEGSYAPPD